MCLMAVVDERSRVPALDEAALARLREALDRAGVVAARLIGSQARGTAGPLSDIDVGVWHDPALDPAARLRVLLSLSATAAEALDTDEVDVVMLNGATPLMRHRAIRDGRPLVERDRAERIRLETMAMRDYFDTMPLRRELAQGLKRRVEEGRFGRR